MAIQEFKFKFMVITIKASLDEMSLTVKQGLRTFRAEVPKLKHLYVLDHENVGHELILTHEVGPNQLKRIRFNASFGEPQFQALINAILVLRPDIDIRKLPVAEAHKLMGATNWVKKAPLIAVGLIVAVVTVMMLPTLLHGLDSGQQTLDVAQCAVECERDTDNLSVRGTLLFDDMIEKETTREGSSLRTIEYYIPLVPPDWNKGDMVHMVVETPDLSDAQFEELSTMPAIPGVLRDTWWEGLGSDELAFFKKDIALNMAPGVRLLEYKADPKDDLYLALAVIGVVFFIMFIVVIVIAIKGGASRKSQLPQS